MKKVFIYKATPVGDIIIVEMEGFITHLLFSTELKLTEMIGESYIAEESPLIRETKRQLDDYFAGTRKDFEIPLKPSGTEFQTKVWKALKKIPYAETRSYKQIAEQVGYPKAYRAVGHANNQNPISIIIPCHRVIGANGKMVGYGGGIGIKEKLLTLENSVGGKNNSK